LEQVQEAALTSRSLRENEEIVDRGIVAFTEVGLALMQIRDERQYRDAGYDRFDDYCTERWGFGRSQTYRLIDAAEVTQAVSPIGDVKPATESVARELAPIAKRDPEEAREVWAAVVAEHGDSPTAKQTAETRDRFIAAEPQPQIPGQTDLVETVAEVISPEQAPARDFVAERLAERRARGEFTDPRFMAIASCVTTLKGIPAPESIELPPDTANVEALTLDLNYLTDWLDRFSRRWSVYVDERRAA
jgi:hypothetical protein